MGCKNSFTFKAEDKLVYYEKYLKQTRINFMENSPLSKIDLENNPKVFYNFSKNLKFNCILLYKGWNSFVIARLHNLILKNIWQSYSAELIKLLEEKPLEQYTRPINSKSWLNLLGKLTSFIYIFLVKSLVLYLK